MLLFFCVFCLKCHAVLNYMIGMQDINLSLRETLKTYINSREVCGQFKERWMSNRREADRAIGVQVETKELEKVTATYTNKQKKEKIFLIQNIFDLLI